MLSSSILINHITKYKQYHILYPFLAEHLFYYFCHFSQADELSSSRPDIKIKTEKEMPRKVSCSMIKSEDLLIIAHDHQGIWTLNIEGNYAFLPVFINSNIKYCCINNLIMTNVDDFNITHDIWNVRFSHHLWYCQFWTLASEWTSFWFVFSILQPHASGSCKFKYIFFING